MVVTLTCVLTFGYSPYASYDHDAPGHLTKLADGKSGNSVISSFDCLVDKVGSRLGMTLALDKQNQRPGGKDEKLT